MARPRDSFDWDLVESLVILEASAVFIAERLLIKDKQPITKHGLTAKSKLIQRRIKERFGINFVQYTEQKRDGRRVRLRQLQWKSAESGNVVMQIWLGKQYLGQMDKAPVKELETSGKKWILAYNIGGEDEEKNG